MLPPAAAPSTALPNAALRTEQRPADADSFAERRLNAVSPGQPATPRAGDTQLQPGAADAGTLPVVDLAAQPAAVEADGDGTLPAGEADAQRALEWSRAQGSAVAAAVASAKPLSPPTGASAALRNLPVTPFAVADPARGAAAGGGAARPALRADERPTGSAGPAALPLIPVARASRRPANRRRSRGGSGSAAVRGREAWTVGASAAGPVATNAAAARPTPGLADRSTRRRAPRLHGGCRADIGSRARRRRSAPARAPRRSSPRSSPPPAPLFPQWAGRRIRPLRCPARRGGRRQHRPAGGRCPGRTGADGERSGSRCPGPGAGGRLGVGPRGPRHPGRDRYRRHRGRFGGAKPLRPVALAADRCGAAAWAPIVMAARESNPDARSDSGGGQGAGDAAATGFQVSKASTSASDSAGRPTAPAPAADRRFRRGAVLRAGRHRRRARGRAGGSRSGRDHGRGQSACCTAQFPAVRGNPT